MAAHRGELFTQHIDNILHKYTMDLIQIGSLPVPSEGVSEKFTIEARDRLKTILARKKDALTQIKKAANVRLSTG